MPAAFFTGASNFICQDNTFNAVSGDQINIYATYHVSVASTIQDGNSSSDRSDPAGRNVHLTSNIVNEVLDQAIAAGTQPVNWRESIVDLMKILKLDASFTARKTLALNWGYRGEENKSYAMNVWLHWRVMSLLRESGGDLEVVRVKVRQSL